MPSRTLFFVFFCVWIFFCDWIEGGRSAAEFHWEELTTGALIWARFKLSEQRWFSHGRRLVKMMNSLPTSWWCVCGILYLPCILCLQVGGREAMRAIRAVLLKNYGRHSLLIPWIGGTIGRTRSVCCVYEKAEYALCLFPGTVGLIDNKGNVLWG